MRKVSAREEMACNARRGGGGAIRFLVADKEARGMIHGPAIEKIQDHSGRGFTPVADLAVFWHCRLRVKWAVANVVEVRSHFRQLDRQLRMEHGEIVLRV